MICDNFPRSPKDIEMKMLTSLDNCKGFPFELASIPLLNRSVGSAPISHYSWFLLWYCTNDPDSPTGEALTMISVFFDSSKYMTTGALFELPLKRLLLLCQRVCQILSQTGKVILSLTHITPPAKRWTRFGTTSMVVPVPTVATCLLALRFRLWL